jgi:dTDP-4-dehydrorhamnose 3,5-epimerase
MKITETDFNGLLIIEPMIFQDERGYLYESFHSGRYEEAGLTEKFLQDNISKSVKNTVRGLHYQAGDKAQGKLCHVLHGSVLDIAVDIRFGSPTFGHYFAIELSEDNKLQLWIPPGFAHGFSVLSDEAIFRYKCTQHYDKSAERAILYNDPDLNIDWKVETPVVSQKDLKATPFNLIEQEFVFR